MLHLGLLLASSAAAFPQGRPSAPLHAPTELKDDAPLILTGMDPDAARNASLVTTLNGWDRPSHAGFFTTQPKTRNNMFFWYFPAQCGASCPDAPLVIWLQGGPGGSSMFGLFAEMGPFNANASLKLVKREAGAWTDKYAMLFIDNPVGGLKTFFGC